MSFGRREYETVEEWHERLDREGETWFRDIIIRLVIPVIASIIAGTIAIAWWFLS